MCTEMGEDDEAPAHFDYLKKETSHKQKNIQKGKKNTEDKKTGRDIRESDNMKS